MLRITEARSEKGTRRVEAQGRLVGPWVDELQRAAGSVSKDPQLVIDVSGVSFVDPSGIRLLRNLAENGVAIEGVTPYIAELIEQRAGGER